MAHFSYRRLNDEFHARDNFAELFGAALEKVASNVDFSRVESCVAFGTSGGEREMEFARRFLPNLRSFTAVDPDREAVEALRTSFRDGQLPGVVETSVVETRLQSWSGAGDDHVDAVLLFNVLCHVNAADRRALFQKLTTYLSRGGVVVISDNDTSVPSGYYLLLERLGTRRENYDEMEKEMLAAGFRLVSKQDYEIRCDLSNPSDDHVKFIQLMTERSETEVRAAIADIFSRPNMSIRMKKVAIFTK